MPRPIGKPWSKTSVHGTFHPVLRLPLKMTKIQLNQYPGKRALSGRLIDICTSRMVMSYGSKRFTKAPSLGHGPPGKRGNQMKFVGTALFMCPTNKKFSFVPKYGKLLRPESSLMSEKDGLSSSRKKRSCWKPMACNSKRQIRHWNPAPAKPPATIARSCTKNQMFLGTSLRHPTKAEGMYLHIKRVEPKREDRIEVGFRWNLCAPFSSLRSPNHEAGRSLGCPAQFFPSLVPLYLKCNVRVFCPTSAGLVWRKLSSQAGDHNWISRTLRRSVSLEGCQQPSLDNRDSLLMQSICRCWWFDDDKIEWVIRQ